jgi:hypothetical protein
MLEMRLSAQSTYCDGSLMRQIHAKAEPLVNLQSFRLLEKA